MIFVAPAVYSQNGINKPMPFLKLSAAAKPYAASVLKVKTPATQRQIMPFLSPNYYASHLGFFCQQEIKIAKSAKIPLKFRLGSIEDCDRLEGKVQRP